LISSSFLGETTRTQWFLLIELVHVLASGRARRLDEGTLPITTADLIHMPGGARRGGNVPDAD